MEEKGKVYGSATVPLRDGAARAKSHGRESWRAGQLTRPHRLCKHFRQFNSNRFSLGSWVSVKVQASSLSFDTLCFVLFQVNHPQKLSTQTIPPSDLDLRFHRSVDGLGLIFSEGMQAMVRLGVGMCLINH